MYTNPLIGDSVVSNEDYAKRAVDLKHGIISTMEHGFQGRYYEGYQLSQKYNLKFLFGTEAYWVKDRTSDDKSNCHIYIGAKNENGRMAINDILSEANTTGFYYRPRIDIPLILSLPKEDVWVTSACVAFWKYDDIDAIVEQFRDYFGDSFFLEVQYHNTKKQANLNDHILALHNQLKIPLIMGCDSHYIDLSGSQSRDDFLASKNITYEDEEGWFLDYPDGDTAYDRFVKQSVLSHNDICDAIDNTNIFLEVEDYDTSIFDSEIKLPELPDHKGWTQEQKDEEYKRLVWTGWDNYKSQVPEIQHNYYEQEIQSEAQIVIDTKMSEYFNINYRVIKQGKENGGWLTKSGRGSAVSFITNMLLGFTEVDRIAAKVHMYPERFMSTTRILQSGSLPDIDFNVAPVEPFAKAQQQVLGENHAYPMISYGTMKTSAAWKLYAKSQGIVFEVANEVAQQIKKYETSLKHAEEDEKEFINVEDYIEPQYHDIFAKSAEYQSVISSWSIAPCSYLLYQGDIRRKIGLVKIKDHLCCLMDGHWAEDCHFLKNDLLKVTVVDLIYSTFKRIGMEPFSVNELLRLCPPEDDAWKMYSTGCTVSLNQVERTGTSARVTKYKPTNISELCAFIAAIRPGFKSMYKRFESRMPFSYGVSTFDNLIQTEEMPNSFVLYQEQEMQALNYAGIPMDECYTAIKNIAKKRVEKVLAYKDTFISGLSASIVRDEGKSKEEAIGFSDMLWKIIEDSASYSFNASHSYCVAVDSLYSAWLKAHYPCQFYETALKVCEIKGNKDKMADLRSEAQTYFGIKFPSFRFGQDNREINSIPENKIINNSLASIKGFGKTIGECLWNCANDLWEPDFIDILQYLNQHSLKRAKVEPLIKIGYFSEFGNQAQLLSILEFWDLLRQGTSKKINKDKIEAPPLIDMIQKFATGNKKDGSPAASWTFKEDGSCLQFLRLLQEYILSQDIPELSFKTQIANQKDILGYVNLTTGKEEDRRKLYILSLYELPDRFNGGIWKIKIKTRSIGSGKEASLDLSPAITQRNPIQEGSVIEVKDEWLSKDRKGYWSLYKYNVIE